MKVDLVDFSWWFGLALVWGFHLEVILFFFFYFCFSFFLFFIFEREEQTEDRAQGT